MKRAERHFLSVKRTKRARSIDAAKNKKSALISANDPRYYTSEGPSLYDVASVDDGSARARSIAYRGAYSDPQRNQDSISPLLHRVMTKGKQIGAGKQATVWQYDGAAWKIFKQPFQLATFAQNVAFLKENQKSGVVPVLLHHDQQWGYIKMQLLRNYQPLEKNVLARSQRYRVSLIKAIAAAREKLPWDQEFGDLTNFSNIAVRHAPNGLVATVKFYEGGKVHHYRDEMRARHYIMEMAALLKVTRFWQNFNKRRQA